MLLRDFRRLWSQSLAIALVLACGVMILLTAFGMHRALDDTLTAFYERNEMADIWANVDRAPSHVVNQIAALDGVTQARGRIEKYLILDIPGRIKSASGLALSLPVDGDLPDLNVPIVRSGRLPAPRASDEVMVNEPFAIANGFEVGDTFSALLSGQKRELTITGTALSPEFVYAIGPGNLMPDDAGFGVLWLPEIAMAAAFDMTGAVNSIAVSLTRDTQPEAVVADIDDLLDPYGGSGAFLRKDQMSHAFVSTEIEQLKNMAIILPPIFFGISAFLVNMVIGRIIALERTEIGLMKALGYADLHIAAHFVLLAGLTALIGIALGWLTGGLAARGMAGLYAQYFKFPYLIFNVSYDAYAISGFLALLTAAIGALRSALGAARLPPAVAMSPPAPPRYKKGLLDRMLSSLRLSQPTMMIWRSLLRWPVRTFMSAVGLSMAVAVLIAAGFFISAMDKIVDVAFSQSNRQDAMLVFTAPRPLSALEDVRRLPGVIAVEGEYQAAVTLHNGHLNKQLAIITRGEGATLARAVDDQGRTVEPQGEGIIITNRVAEVLDLARGDMVDVEFMTGRKETFRLPVSGVVTQYFGLGAYMARDAMAHLTRDGIEISLANISLDSAASDAFNQTIKETPAIASAVRLGDMLSGFEDTLDQNVNTTNTLFIVIAMLITVGLTYNSARILLSERARELASLRILGFSNSEVSYVLVGETMLIAVLAQPLGWIFGALISSAMASSFTSDLYSIPLVLTAASFAKASLVVLGTSLLAVLFVRRRIDRFDLVSVMKTRE
ncbi:ABC transporter permease [Celeribacter arenosi]